MTDMMPTVIELTTSFCPVCKSLKPILAPIIEKYSDKIQFKELDAITGEGAQYAQLYKVRKAPTFIFMNSNGTVSTTHSGFVSVEQFTKYLEAILL